MTITPPENQAFYAALEEFVNLETSQQVETVGQALLDFLNLDQAGRLAKIQTIVNARASLSPEIRAIAMLVFYIGAR